MLTSEQLKYQLCYIERSWAWFTSDFENQWGDDWDDAPYEHNAGTPYSKEVELIRVAWEGPYQTPKDLVNFNSPWSVKDINKGAVAWLTPDLFVDNADPILAGCPLGDFIEQLQRYGGAVYLKYNA